MQNPSFHFSFCPFTLPFSLYFEDNSIVRKQNKKDFTKFFSYDFIMQCTILIWIL